MQIDVIGTSEQLATSISVRPSILKCSHITSSKICFLHDYYINVSAMESCPQAAFVTHLLQFIDLPLSLDKDFSILLQRLMHDIILSLVPRTDLCHLDFHLFSEERLT